jgi:hypothetical protein
MSNYSHSHRLMNHIFYMGKNEVKEKRQEKEVNQGRGRGRELLIGMDAETGGIGRRMALHRCC